MSRIDIHTLYSDLATLSGCSTILVPAEVVNVEVMTTQGYTSTMLRFSTNLEMTKPGQLQYLSCSKSSKTS